MAHLPSLICQFQSSLHHELRFCSHVFANCWAYLVWMVSFVKRAAKSFSTTTLPKFLRCCLITTHAHKKIEQVSDCEATRRVHINSLAEVFLGKLEILSYLSQECGIIIKVDNIAWVGTDGSLEVSLCFLMSSPNSCEKACIAPEVIRMAGSNLETAKKQPLSMIEVALHRCNEPCIITDRVHVLHGMEEVSIEAPSRAEGAL